MLKFFDILFRLPAVRRPVREKILSTYKIKVNIFVYIGYQYQLSWQVIDELGLTDQ